MAEARRGRSAAGRPAGWMILLGLMALALLIAAVNKGCGGSDGGSPASQSPTGTSTSPGNPADTTAALAVIAQINQKVQASPITFVTGKSELTTTGNATLDQVTAILQSNPAVKAEVRGHTDSEGDATKNLQLSQSRAEAVVAYLVAKGVANDRLTAKGLGEGVPIADNATEAGRAKNRRVEFQLAP